MFFTFLNLGVNEFKDLIKRLSEICMGFVVRSHHLVYHWVENLAAEEVSRNCETAIDQTNFRGVPIINIEAVEVEELVCLNEFSPMKFVGEFLLSSSSAPVNDIFSTELKVCAKFYYY